MSNPTTGLYTKIFYGAAGADAASITDEILEINTQGDLSDEAAEIAVPTFNSEYTRTIPGQKTASAFELTLNWIPSLASHAAMKAAYDGRTKHSFKIELKDADGSNTLATSLFEGYVTSFSISNPVDGVRTAAVRVSLDGGFAIS